MKIVVWAQIASIVSSATLTPAPTCLGGALYGATYKFCLKQDDSAGYCCSQNDTQDECLSTTLCTQQIPSFPTGAFAGSFAAFYPGVQSNHTLRCGGPITFTASQSNQT